MTATDTRGRYHEANIQRANVRRGYSMGEDGRPISRHLATAHQRAEAYMKARLAVERATKKLREVRA